MWMQAVLTLCLLTVTLSLSNDERQSRCCHNLQTEMRKKIGKLRSCDRKRECPVGFRLFKGVCYWFRLGHNDIPDWWAAQNWCNDHGGNLITVNEHRREVFIREHLQANFPKIDGEIKIYTGLLLTDKNAFYPHLQHNLRNNPISNKGDGLRWVNTKETVRWGSNLYTQTDTFAKWSPNVNGDYQGPSQQLYLSCVVIVWNPDSSPNLVWRFNDCTESGLRVICEVRLHPRTFRSPLTNRNKRSPLLSYRDILLGGHNQLSHFDLYDNEDVGDNDDDDNEWLA